MNFKFLLLLVAGIFLSGKSFARVYTKTITKSLPQAIGYSFLNADDKYTDPSTFTVNSVNDAVTLNINDNSYIGFNFTYSVTLKIECFTDATSSTPSATYTPTLTVSYSTVQGAKYQGIADYTFVNAYRVKITITGVSNNGTTNPTMGMVTLTNFISVDRSYVFQPSFPVNPAAVAVNNGTAGQQLQISWGVAPGAEEYDVEWTSIAAGDANESIAAALAAGTGDASQANLLFRNNASRITTDLQNYNLNVITNDDYFITRIRGVHYTTDGIRQLGDWCYAKSGGGFTAWVVNAATSPILTWHQPLFNWQYSASFAEDGKRKEVISYFDGTLRSRQTVTVNSTDNVPVVQENVFDLFGRPVASILPAPVKEGGINVPFLHYFQNLNVNAAQAQYSYTDVLGTGSSACEVIPAGLSTARGSSRYYSPQNDFNTDANFSTTYGSYVPDAKTFPLSVTQYTPDNTGRIKLQGGVGPAFQPGTGSPSHTTRYFYGKPDQWELDQLFGNDVGYAEHYLKNMVADANNQISVSYINASGKTIATALTGATPGNLDKVTSQTAEQTKIIHILKPEQFVFDNSSMKLAATTTYLASTTSGPIKFDYDMQKLVYVFTKNSQNICSNCYYDLNIKVVNACNNSTPVYSTTAVVGVKIGDCNNTGTQTGTFSIPSLPDIGEYNIIFEYVLSKGTMEDYVSTFISTGQANGMLPKSWSFIQPYLNTVDYSGILSDCKTCLKLLGTKPAFTQMMTDKLTALDFDFSQFSGTQLTNYNNWVGAKYDSLLTICTALTTNCQYSDCNEVQSQMTQDVSPGGQYGLFDQNNIPLEPNINVISNNWRVAFPKLPASDPGYQANTFTKVDPATGQSVITSLNDAATTLNDVVKYWQPSWALYFLQFHPEYCKLQFCQANQQNTEWDERVQQLAVKYSDIANIKNLNGTPANLVYSTTNGAWLLAKDPFFQAGGSGNTYLSAMTGDLNNYSVNVLANPNLTAPVKNLSQYVDFAIYCSANCSGTDTQTSNCWTNTCSPGTCRVQDRDWAEYKALYFQLKQTYYDKLRSTTTCKNNCSIGHPYTVSTGACPSVNDFSLNLTSGADIAAAGACASDTANYRSITITYLRGTSATLTSYVYLSYSGGVVTTGLPTSFTFAPGTNKIFFCVPKVVPLSGIQIKAVNCTGTAPAPYTPATPTAPGSTIQHKTVTTQNCYIGISFTDYYISDFDPHYPDSFDESGFGALFTIKVKPNVLVCTRTTPMTAVVHFSIAGESDNFFTVDIDPSSYTGKALVEPNGKITQIFVSGNVSACTTTPPANNGCAEAYNYKISRFDAISRSSTYPSDLPTALQQNTDLLAAQIKSSCAGNADRWIVELADGLAAYPAGTIATLKANLTKFCSDNGDQDHPFGATTLNPSVSPNPNAPATSFGDIIKSSLGLSGFTKFLNPWLIDGPNPYAVATQSANYNISASNAKICLVISNLNAAYVASGSGLTFYNYLVATYGAAMNLTSTEFTQLQNSCSACNFVLPQDMTLPVFMQPGASGCITSSAYAAAKTELLSNFAAGTLPSTDYYYPRILTNFMNQKFGFALSWSQYSIYDAAPTAILCNQPPFLPSVTDPYALIETQLAVGVANGMHDYTDYIDDQKQQFRTNYINTCSAAQANVTLTVPTQLYHFTLYYYDQADNLVRTVPPEGVKLLTAAQIAQVDQARDGGDVASCGAGFTGPTSPDPVGAFTQLSTTLSAKQNAAIELWMYNPGGAGNQVVQTTPDGKYLFQLNISGTTLTADIWSVPSNGVFAMDNHVTANLAGIPPLQPWTHIVLQSANLTTSPLQVYVNGNKLPILVNPPPASYGASTAALKHMRIYDRLLNNSEITVNAQNNCFMPINSDGHWYRFNIPPAGGETTVGGGTQETRLTGVYPTHYLTSTYAYNSTNQVVQQSTPDGGLSSYWYDMLSRLVISQNAKQLAANNYSYTTYDQLGRINEVGQKTLANAGLGGAGFLYDYAITAFNTAGANAQITHTYYDAIKSGITGLQSGLLQSNLRKRVAATSYSDVQAGPVLNATYYNYDIDGNVSTLWQQVNGLETKRVDYEYDLISGKVNFIRYQNDPVTPKKDQFFYQYKYDANNRLTEVWSGTTALVKPFAGSQLMPDNQRMDAAYFYYLHGPLARMELGDASGKVQGVDYAYTLQGWLKGVNNQGTGLTTDIGKDGIIAAGNLNQPIARDAFAYSLGYYSNATWNDYYSINAASTAFNMNYVSATGDVAGQSLWNGNISNNVLSISQLNSGAPVGYTYHYDQLNRLKRARQQTGLSGTTFDRTKLTLDYQENVTYDGNGNILTYGRNGATTGTTPTTQTIDSLSYHYSKDINTNLLTNRALYVTDAIASSGYTGDITTQSSSNYKFDAIGNITYDAQSGITGNGGTNSITWNVYGKIQTIYKATGNIVYTYDAVGHRVSKTTGGVTTWYIRDAQGNALAVYDNAGATINWKEQDLYGSSRLGLWAPNLNITTGSTADPNAAFGIEGATYFELSNHLGNVLATISDKRLQHNNGTATPDFLPDVITAQDYYPFGMLQPGRQFQAVGSTNYRYGFNGKENADEVNGEGNTIAYEARMYDTRIARWLSVDPLYMKFADLSPYLNSENNPIYFMDNDGKEPNRSQAANWSQIRAVLVNYFKDPEHQNIHKLRYTENDGGGGQVGPFGGSNGPRYIYTEKYGWVDLGHFFQVASMTQEKGGSNNKSVQWTAQHSITSYYIAKLLLWNKTKDVENHQPEKSDTKWSYEDAPSNLAGLDFWFKAYRGDKKLLESLDTFFKDAGATDPAKAPNYDIMEDTPQKSRWFEQNKSFEKVDNPKPTADNKKVNKDKPTDKKKKS